MKLPHHIPPTDHFPLSPLERDLLSHTAEE